MLLSAEEPAALAPPPLTRAPAEPVPLPAGHRRLSPAPRARMASRVRPCPGQGRGQRSPAANRRTAARCHSVTRTTTHGSAKKATTPAAKCSVTAPTGLGPPHAGSG